jgi:diguanylate cyclase (GGDEF)-like protein
VLVLIGALVAGLVVLAGGGDAFWVCVPGALLVAALSPTRLSSLLRGGAVILAAAVPSLISASHYPLPATALVIVIPVASLVVLVEMRTRLERERDALRHSAATDSLTGIANRRSLLERIDYEISRHARARHSFALVMLDLDGFKALNDRFGHAAGDDLLRETAAALERTVRAQDTAARIGGDEFCVLAPETDAAGLVQLETRISRGVAGATTGLEVLSASTGAATFPRDGTSAEALLAAADARLLAAKRELRRSVPQRRAA